MAACDPTTLIAQSRCLDRCIPDGMKLAVLINVFARLANMSTDPTTLMAGARCLDRCLPDGISPRLGVLIYVACNITGGAGGGGQILTYTTTDPTTDGVFPADQTQPAIAYGIGATQTVFTWDTVNHVWL